MEQFSSKDRKRLQLKEQARALGRAAKRATGKMASKSVTKIEVDGVECTSCHAMETKLLEVNYAKIRASDDTAFLQELLLPYGPCPVRPRAEDREPRDSSGL